MINIKNIIKNTLTQLKKKDLLATPKNYYKEFILQSRLVDIKDEEKIIIDRITKDLPLILKDILAPSIDTKVDKDIDKLINYINNNYESILDQKTMNQIQNIVRNRIINDKEVIKNKSKDFNKIATLMGKYFNKLLLESGNSSAIVNNIKEELEELSISSNSKRELGILHGKLISSIHSIEMALENSKEELISNQSHFSKLEETIKKLQEDIENAKEENKTDYLTNVLNRRAFDVEIEKFDKTFSLFDGNYAIVFYDIDYFKKINDTYGHDCGDAILRTFAGILKDLSREEDIVARYGGEEFVVLLNYNKKDELAKYIQRVKKTVDTNKFNYKEHKDIELKFSAGIASRDKYNSFQETLESADSLLYKAKEAGRDTIYFD
ncbi:MAG: GGDEF domain-containing protein [Campylobacterota bacterium]|nr:GGDEF domain-containing protein [Campylobacterota bacterium]